MSNPTTTEILSRLTSQLTGLSKELTKAAIYLLEHPNEIGVSSIRMIAEAADVKPNTLVRLARSLGFQGYEDFRQPFREEIKTGRESYPDRVSWLQSLASGGTLGGLYTEMARDAMRNVEQLYAQTDVENLKAAAEAVIKARTTYVLGLGIAGAPARNFAYLANMTIGSVRYIPENGALPVDGLLQARPEDLLFAMTFKPYRRVVVDTVDIAAQFKIPIISVSDSPVSPIATQADHRFIVPTQTPQFFTSTIALTAFLETFVAFVVAAADKTAVRNIDLFHRRRREFGMYWEVED